MTDGRQELLKSLAIERPARATASRAPNRIARAAALFLAALAVALTPKALNTTERERTSTPLRQEAPPRAPAPVASHLSASGYVAARRSAAVGAEVTAKIAKILFEEGAHVQAGQTLAQLDDDLVRHDLIIAQKQAQAAQAGVTSATAELEDAERIVARAKTLAQNQWTTVADLTRLEARAAVLSAQLLQAKSQLETAQAQVQRAVSTVQKYQLRAPFSGVVTEKSAQMGEIISPLSVGGATRTGLCTLVDLDSIEIDVDVNELFVSKVVVGDAVTAVLDAYPDWPIPASVIGTAPAANREKATVKVRIKIDESDPRVLPNMAVKVTFGERPAPGGDAREADRSATAPQRR